MEYNDQARSLLRELTEKPVDPSHLRNAGTMYWSLIEENVDRCIRERSDMGVFLAREYDLVNFGISPEVLANANEIAERLRMAVGPERPVKVQLVSDWLMETYTKIMAGDRKDALEKEMKLAHLQVRRLEQDIAMLQHQRREIVLKELTSTLAAEAISECIEKTETADGLFRQNQKIKKMSSKGIFLPVSEKRKHCEQEEEYASCCEQIERFLSAIPSRETLAVVKQCCGQVREDIAGILDSEETIARITNEIAGVAKKQQTISPVEITAAMFKEIEYVRDLLRLSAHRVHAESCGFLRSGDVFFTIKEAADCVDRIVEFDPKIFHNPRVPIFGLPSVLLVPGNGNALYDWKGNRIIVPLVAPSGNFMASVAFGMIEYRLDVDESKQLLDSYMKLPRHTGVKSVFHLKNELTKDYITWMTSEYRGYKNLASDVRKWFEHEIAPSKNDIAIPMEYRPFFLASEAFNKKCKDVEEHTAASPGACSEEVLWAGSILLYQQGKFERAMELLKALVAKKPDHTAALYNLGFTCMKLMRKQEAIGFFNDYCKRNPQSWWATVAMEHLRRLQTGHAN